MVTKYIIAGTFTIGMMALVVGPAPGQPYPNKPIRIVTGGVGGGSDFLARLIAPAVSVPLAQLVIVDNRSGGFTPGQIVSKAPADGYTLLLQGGVFWIASLIQKVPYDPLGDFSPITMTSREPNVLVVHPSLPVKSVKELIALVKVKPGSLNYSSGLTGSSPHLAGELLKSLAGVNIIRIPYNAAAPALNAVVGGEVQMTIVGAAAATPFIKSGRLRALAVTSAEPSALFPDLPTVAATVPGFELISISAMYIPAKTPEAIIQRLNREIVRVVSQADVKEKLFNVGQEIVGSSPEQLAAYMKSDMAKIGKLIKEVGIRVD